MSAVTAYLMIFRRSANERAHFGIYFPTAKGAQKGTLIHVVGLPMAGFDHEFKRGYNPLGSMENLTHWPAEATKVAPWSGEAIIEDVARNNVESVTLQVEAPRKSQNFLAPVNDPQQAGLAQQAGPAQQATQQPVATQQAAKQTSEWEWDAGHQLYRRYDWVNKVWIWQDRE
ncbi:hypothetical protein BDV96DRAFT_603302 [Lophiotrema nucula]|uniref:Uncharacterized protein n=1 Tax=Lophiotrema nucula TaxID=690887 RepID=A0A6A5YYI4_9PLEO|nr:hypothetical protein BDV96DRAFT_603302 [Lophiotrema nucula]